MGSIILPPDIYNQWMFYVQECDSEVSAMGRVVRQGADFLVTKLYLLEQEVGAAHTDIDAEAICKLMLETMDDEGDLLYWVHSHVNMQAFWSGTDLETIRTMGKNGLCLASVFNKKGESKHAICYKTTVDYTGETEITLHDDIKCIIGTPITLEQKEIWKADLASKLRKRTFTMPTTALTYSNHNKYTVYDEEYAKIAPSTYNNYSPWDEGEYGIFGYGADVEAEALKIPVDKYKSIVRGNDKRAYEQLEAKLEKLWREGKFV